MIPALHITDIPADVRGWLASEKLDGVRAIWTGTSLLSRNGRDFRPPPWFTAALPAVSIDGELWMGRGTFPRLLSTMQRRGSDWCGIRFMIFETCTAEPVEMRIAAVEKLPLPAHAVPVKHFPLRSHAHLDAMEADIVNAGGEGVVIRRPGSKYRPGRAGEIVKIKRLVSDADCSQID